MKRNEEVLKAAQAQRVGASERTVSGGAPGVKKRNALP